jgi:hypothetical protein
MERKVIFYHYIYVGIQTDLFNATVSNNAHGFRSLKSSIFQPCPAVIRQSCQKIELYCRERLSKLRNCCLAECIKGKKTRWRQVKQNLLAIMGGEETIRPPNQCQYFGASYPPLTAGYSSTLPPLTAGYSNTLPPLTAGYSNTLPHQIHIRIQLVFFQSSSEAESR